jgi:hypothetical protein
MLVGIAAVRRWFHAEVFKVYDSERKENSYRSISLACSISDGMYASSYHYSSCIFKDDKLLSGRSERGF